MKTPTINWTARTDLATVLMTVDFELRFTTELSFKTLPFGGAAGYQLVYRPTGHVQAEGVDIVAAVAQTFREQRILDKVRSKPELLSEDPAQGNLAAFLEDVDVSGRSAN